MQNDAAPNLAAPYDSAQMNAQREAAPRGKSQFKPGEIPSIIAAVAAMTIAGSVVGLVLHPAMPDDAYIYMRFARQRAEIGGTMFNPGETLAGFTSWLQYGALCLAAFAKLRLEDVAFGLGAALHALGAGLMALAVGAARPARRGAWVVAALAGLWLAFDSLLVATIGLESGWMVAGILACLALYFNDRKNLALALSGLLIFARPDAALLPAALFIDDAIRRRRIAWLPLFFCLLCAGAWAALNKTLGGEWLPATLAAKQAQNASGLCGPSFGAKLFSKGFPRLEGRWAYYLILALLILRFLFAAARGGDYARFRFVPIWALAYALAYAALGVPATYYWYYAPLTVAVHWMAGVGAIAWLEDARSAQSREPSRNPALRFAAALVLAAFAVYPWAMLRFDFQDKHLQSRRDITAAWREAAAMLSAKAPPTATVAAVEIGVLGTELPNPLVDLMGIVTPQVRDSLRRGDVEAPFRQFKPYFVIAHDPPLVFEAPVVTGNLKKYYHVIYKGGEPGGAFGPIIVLERYAGAPDIVAPGMTANRTAPLHGGNS